MDADPSVWAPTFTAAGDVLVYEKRRSRASWMSDGWLVCLGIAWRFVGNGSIFGRPVRRELPGMCEYEDVGEHPIRRSERLVARTWNGRSASISTVFPPETASGATVKTTTVRRSEVLVVGDNRDHTGSAQVVLDAQIVGPAWMIFGPQGSVPASAWTDCSPH